MRSRHPASRRAAALAALAALALAAASLLVARPAAARQPRPPAEEEAMRLVVMIRAELRGAERVGAGVIVGAANDRLYVATADHVVREGGEEASDITVELRGLPGERVPARLLADHDAAMDLAVLSVSGLAALGAAAEPAFDRLGDPAALRRGDRVHALGFPQASPWAVNVAPDPISATSDSVLTFESAFVSVGHSGGALLDEQWRIVGLLQTVEPPVATARRMDVVLDRLRAWRYPVHLRRRFADATLELVSAGGGFTCAVGARGTAACWGRNTDGELGTGGADTTVATPSPVHGGLAFATVSAGLWYACGITLDGVLHCWGNGESGELGARGVARSRVPVPVGGDLRFTSVSAGADHACAVATTGAVYCWGGNEYGQLGDGTTEPRAEPARVRSDLSFRAVSAGSATTCALTTAGRAYCWGSNARGGLDDGTTRSSAHPVPVAGDLTFASLAVGSAYACGVTTGGAGYCWGHNEWGQLGDGTERDATRPTPIAGGLRFTMLSANRTGGRSATCGVTTDGAAYCWGGLDGAGGRQDGDPRLPGRVATDARFRAVSVDAHVCALAVDGEVHCWGSNHYGQLGDGVVGGERVTPRVVPGRP